MTCVVYSPELEGWNQLCLPVDPADFDAFRSWALGGRRPAPWPGMKVINEDRGRPLSESDAYGFVAAMPILSGRAVDVLSKLLEPVSEIVPFEVADRRLAAVRISNVIEGLDRDTSELALFPGTSDVMAVKRYQLLPDVVSRHDVFGLSGFRISPTFVSGRFVERWRSSGLTGWEFREIFRAA